MIISWTVISRVHVCVQGLKNEFRQTGPVFVSLEMAYSYRTGIGEI